MLSTSYLQAISVGRSSEPPSEGGNQASGVHSSSQGHANASQTLQSWSSGSGIFVIPSDAESKTRLPVERQQAASEAQQPTPQEPACSTPGSRLALGPAAAVPHPGVQPRKKRTVPKHITSGDYCSLLTSRLHLVFRTSQQTAVSPVPLKESARMRCTFSKLCDSN